MSFVSICLGQIIQANRYCGSFALTYTDLNIKTEAQPNTNRTGHSGRLHRTLRFGLHGIHKTLRFANRAFIYDKKIR